MRDDRELLALDTDLAIAPDHGANVILFPSRQTRARQPVGVQITAQAVTSTFDLIATRLPPDCAGHAATRLAAVGAVAGFAAQQSLLLAGGLAWAQPARNGHLDRLLMSDGATDASLWYALRTSAHALGTRHLPDPQKLLEATLRCVGTTQLGRITLPLEYRLIEQPQPLLGLLWPAVRAGLDELLVAPSAWPLLLARTAAQQVTMEPRRVPPHVALRIVMQAAIAMALIEPRGIQGAAVKPGTQATQ